MNLGKRINGVLRRGGIFRSADGGMRLIWLWLLGFALYYLWIFVSQWAFAHLFGQIYQRAMGLSYGEFLQVPDWSMAAAYGYQSLFSIIENVGTLLIFLGLTKYVLHLTLRNQFSIARMLKWTVLGSLAAVAGVLICLMVDSLRLELPLSEPRFAWNIVIALPVCFLSTLAGEVFMLLYLYESAQKRLQRIPSIVLLIIVEFLAEGSWRLSWIGMINAILQLFICCLLYDRYGLAAPTGLWFGWSFIFNAVFTLSAGGLWTVYHVSDLWLTGGNHGLFNGAWATAVLIGIGIYLTKFAKCTLLGKIAKASRN